ncbi:DUF3872 domain-containing protein [Elizabethkingia ursingii]|nr:DUF3872 domain-containing protein [Elizabethkingia ursingii]MCL1666551.1 DUF3872 domain-containing protein [Elizabethkingia ursingii]
MGFFLLSACDNQVLDVQEIFPFEVKVMPVPKEIAKGETVEVRISIITNGDYSDNQYHLRYFQNEGKGSLRYFHEKPYLPNDSYIITEKEFRLYYTSESIVSQKIDIWIVDSFGNEKQLSLQFNSKKLSSTNIDSVREFLNLK